MNKILLLSILSLGISCGGEDSSDVDEAGETVTKCKVGEEYKKDNKTCTKLSTTVSEKICNDKNMPFVNYTATTDHACKDKCSLGQFVDTNTQTCESLLNYPTSFVKGAKKLTQTLPTKRFSSTGSIVRDLLFYDSLSFKKYLKAVVISESDHLILRKILAQTKESGCYQKPIFKKLKKLDVKNTRFCVFVDEKGTYKTLYSEHVLSLDKKVYTIKINFTRELSNNNINESLYYEALDSADKIVETQYTSKIFENCSVSSENYLSCAKIYTKTDEVNHTAAEKSKIEKAANKETCKSIRGSYWNVTKLKCVAKIDENYSYITQNLFEAKSLYTDTEKGQNNTNKSKTSWKDIGFSKLEEKSNSYEISPLLVEIEGGHSSLSSELTLALDSYSFDIDHTKIISDSKIVKTYQDSAAKKTLKPDGKTYSDLKLISIAPTLKKGDMVEPKFKFTASEDMYGSVGDNLLYNRMESIRPFKPYDFKNQADCEREHFAWSVRKDTDKDLCAEYGSYWNSATSKCEYCTNPPPAP